MAANKNKKFLIGPDEGAYLPVLDITHKVTAESFGGAFTIIEVGLPPGEMIPPPPHVRGRVRLRAGRRVDLRCRRRDRGRPGWLVRSQAKRGLPRLLQHGHGAYNRHLEIHTPGEFENYYDEYEQIVESEMGEEERRKARVELGERYGVTWHEELIPEVRARFGLEP